MNKTSQNSLFKKIHIMSLWLIYYIYTFYYMFSKPIIKSKILKKKWSQYYEDLIRYNSKALKLFNVNVILENPYNIPLDKSYIIVANHRSWFDQLSIIANFPLLQIHFLAKEGYFKILFFGYGMKLYEYIPVIDKSISSENFYKISSFLKRKDCVLIYAEGTRGSGKNLLPFAPGTFITAARTGSPVLPLYILGSENILSKKNSLLSLKSGTIKIVIDSPVFFSKSNWKKESIEFEEAYRIKFTKLSEEFEFHFCPCKALSN